MTVPGATTAQLSTTLFLRSQVSFTGRREELALGFFGASEEVNLPSDLTRGDGQLQNDLFPTKQTTAGWAGGLQDL